MRGVKAHARRTRFLFVVLTSGIFGGTREKLADVVADCAEVPPKHPVVPRPGMAVREDPRRSQDRTNRTKKKMTKKDVAYLLFLAVLSIVLHQVFFVSA